MTTPVDQPAPVAATHSHWSTRLVLVLIALVVLAVAVLLGITVLPRWWAHRVGAVADGSITAGVFAGLTCGVVFTAIPLFLLGRVFGRHRSWRARIIWLVLAAIVAIPNLTTLMIVLGTGEAAHAGERTMDVDAPGFRGATLIGSIVGALLIVVVWVMLFGRRRRVRELHELRAERDQAQALAKADAQARDEARRTEEHLDPPR